MRGFTKVHPDVREELRGTYAGLASEPALQYLKDLGVTAVELLPVHHICDESFLHEKQLTNYWGYSTIGYFAPHSEYAATGRRGEQVREFKGMVKALHEANIEVILDVVYNHTAEGNHLGPMLSFKGVDNASYYRLVPDDPHHYMDFTGTGNSLNAVNPAVLRLIMDSLRYFVTECHVDGFRFDLASALARELYDVDRLSAFFDTIHQDPILSQVKLIAEPWDVGPGGYQVGNFPILWSEWNGVYRDTMRDFWRASSPVGQLAERLSGSADLYEEDGREPFASINFITAHDGFTLRDLVSYNEKHNTANGEDNRDGTDDNRSWNCGAEGETDDAEIVQLRLRQQRNFLTTLMVSQGTPMLLGGDELNRTQHGNNNGWCQDSELSWYDWNQDEERDRMHAFAQRLIRLRRDHCTFRREDFLRGRELDELPLPDVWWFRPDGRKMTSKDWEHGEAVLGMFLNGQAILSRGPRGEEIEDRLVRAAVQRPLRGPHVHAAAALDGPAVGARAVDRRPRCRAGQHHLRGPRCRGRDGPFDPDPQAHRGQRPMRGLMSSRPIRATYRLQLTPTFTFADAQARIPYLRDLGVSHLYLSPSLQARDGSTHGYDVVDPTRISEDLGGEAALRQLADAAHGAGLGLVLDIVPNHMATDDANPFWTDPALREQFFDLDPATGRHRRFFDIDDLAGVAPGGPRGLRADPPPRAEPDRRRGHRRPAHRPSRRPARPGAVLRAAARRRRGHRLDREDPRGRRAAARLAQVTGTVGYEFLNQVCSLFVDPAGEPALTSLWQELSGDGRPFSEVALEAKYEQASTTFAPEFDR